MCIANGFCVLFLLFSSFSYAEQEWRILLMPANTAQPQFYQSHQIHEINQEKVQANIKAKKAIPIKQHSQDKPFNYGVIQSQLTSQNKSSSNKLSPNLSENFIENIHFTYNENIEHAIASQLIALNYEVLDKVLLLKSKPEFNALIKESAGKKLSKEKFAQAVNENIQFLENNANIMIRYQLSVQRQSTNTIPKWQISLTSVVLDVLSKKQIESHEETFVVSGMPVNCFEACEQQWFIQQIKKIARDAGAVITTKLQHLPRRYYYRLTFHDFNTSSLYLVQQLLNEQESKVFSEVLVSADEPSVNQLDEASGSKQYRYVSLLPSDQLEALLNAYFIQQQWQVSSRFEKGNAFSFTREKTPWAVLVLYGLFFIVLALTMFTLFIFIIKIFLNKKKQKKQRTYQQKLFDKTAKQLIQQLKSVNKPYYALSLIDEFLLGFTQTVQDENQQFYQKLQKIRLGYCDKIKPLTGNVIVNNWHVFQIEDNTEIRIGGKSTKTASTLFDLTKNNQMSFNFEGLLQHDNFLNNVVVLSYQQSQFYLTSKFKKQSSQQCFLNNEHLSCDVPQTLPIKNLNQQLLNANLSTFNTLTLGANIDKTINNKQFLLSPCQLHLKYRHHNLLLALDDTVDQLYNTNDLSNLWPDRTIDLAKRWLLQTQVLPIGVNSANEIQLGCFNDERPLVWLYYEHDSDIKGYFIAVNSDQKLETEAKSSPSVFINNIPLLGKVPIEVNTSISFDQNVTHQQLIFKMS